MTFRVTLRGTRLRVEVTQQAITFTVETGDTATVWVHGRSVTVTASGPVTVALEDQGPRLTGTPTTSDIEGSRRADGSLVTASIPRISVDP